MQSAQTDEAKASRRANDWQMYQQVWKQSLPNKAFRLFRHDHDAILGMMHILGKNNEEVRDFIRRATDRSWMRKDDVQLYTLLKDPASALPSDSKHGSDRPASVSHGDNLNARGTYRRLYRDAREEDSLLLLADTAPVLERKLGLSTGRAVKLLNAYHIYGLIGWLNECDHQHGITFLRACEDCPDVTVCAFLDLVTKGERGSEERTMEMTPPPLSEPTPPSSDPESAAEPLVVRTRRPRRTNADIAWATRVLKDPTQVWELLHANSRNENDEHVVDHPLDVVRNSRFKCLLERQILQALMDMHTQGAIRLADDFDQAILLVSPAELKKRSPPTPEVPMPKPTTPSTAAKLSKAAAEPTTTSSKLSLRQAYTVLFEEKSPKKRGDKSVIQHPARMLFKSPDGTSTEQEARALVAELTRLGCLEDLGNGYYGFLASPDPSSESGDKPKPTAVLLAKPVAPSMPPEAKALEDMNEGELAIEVEAKKEEIDELKIDYGKALAELFALEARLKLKRAKPRR